MSGHEIHIFVVIVMLVVFVNAGMRIVPSGEYQILERWGKYLRILRPGINFIVPFVDRVARKLSVGAVTGRVEVVAGLKDSVRVTIELEYVYTIVDPAKAALEANDLIRKIESEITKIIASDVSELDVDSVFEARFQLGKAATRKVEMLTRKFGVEVDRIEVMSINLPEDIVRAMEKQMTAERERRQAALQIEKDRREKLGSFLHYVGQLVEPRHDIAPGEIGEARMADGAIIEIRNVYNDRPLQAGKKYKLLEYEKVVFRAGE